MTTAARRRLTKLEGALRPREAVLAWLAEVQELPDIIDYSRHVAEVPIDAAPMSVIGRRVDAAVRDDMKGKPRDAIEDAVYRATGDALFLFCLVFQINIDAVESARTEGLRAAAVFFWMGSLLGGPRDEDIPEGDVTEHDRQLTSSWTAWLSVVDRLDRDVRVATEVRATIAERYYGGHDVLFADASTDWVGHVELVERLKWFADAIGSSARGKAVRRARARRAALPEVEAGVQAQVSWLTDQAKVRAYEVLGDLPKAVSIMERRIMVEPVPGLLLRKPLVTLRSMPSAKLRLYVDEVGNHDLDKVHEKPAEQFLCLTGVIFDLQYVRDVASPSLERLKEKHLNSHPDEPVVLHRREMMEGKPPFRMLRDPVKRAAFDGDLMPLLATLDYLVITVLIDKWRAYDLYKEEMKHPYHYCMDALVERYVHELRARDAVGDVMAETRGGREDRALRTSFAAAYEGGTRALSAARLQASLTSKELKIKPKKSNIAGLQIADVLAYPAFRTVRARRAKVPLSGDMTGRIGKLLVAQKFRRHSDGARSGFHKQRGGPEGPPSEGRWTLHLQIAGLSES